MGVEPNITVRQRTFIMKTTPSRLALRVFGTPILIASAALLLGSLAVRSRADILYVANEGDNTIEKFTTNGVPSLFATNTVFGAAPFGLAFDSATNLYVAYPNIYTNMVKFSATGSYLFTFAPAAGYIQGIAFDSAGNLYAANASGNTIEKFSATGADLGTFADSGLNSPRGLAFDSAGNLYAANSGNNSIEKFSTNGTDLGTFASWPGSTLSFPFGLAFDSAGNLYVANLLANGIEKFSATGTDLGTFATTGLNTPEGLAFDSAGNLYAASQGTATIEKFTPGGAGSIFASNGVHAPTFLAFTDDAGNPLPLPATIVRPTVSISTTPQKFTFTVQSVAGRTYYLEYTTGLAPASWSTLDSTPGTGGLINLTDLNPTDTQRFYRIRIQ